MKDKAEFQSRDYGDVQCLAPKYNFEPGLLTTKDYSLEYINNVAINAAMGPPDTRSGLRKFIDRWKYRLGHAWYALCGGECD